MMRNDPETKPVAKGRANMRVIRTLVLAAMVGAATTGGLASQRGLAGGLQPTRSSDPQVVKYTGRIRGRVTAAQTGQPIRRAQVTIVGAAGRQTETDENGRYEFGELPPGEFSVSVSKTGYANLRFGQRWPSLGGTPVVLPAGGHADAIDIVLPKAGVVALRVTDDFGDPIPSAHVHVRRYQYATDGQPRLTNAEATGPMVTDDLGQVRIAGLKPGEYVIGVSLERSRAMVSQTARDRSEGFPATYFPGVPTAELAQVVSIGVAEEIGLNFAITPVPLVTVGGTVLASDGRPAAGAFVQVRSAGGAGPALGTQARADGRFSIADLPSGEYVIEARFDARGASPTNAIVARELGIVQMSITQAVADIVVVTRRGATISGRVTVEGASRRIERLPLRVVLQEPDMNDGAAIRSAPAAAANGTVDSDGRFVVGGVFGRVALQVTGLSGFVVKSISVNGRDVTYERMDVTGKTSVSGVEITITDKVTSVTGQVLDARGAIVPSCVAIVVPADSSDTRPAGRLTRIASPATDGRFRIVGLPPGRYSAIALYVVEDGRQYSPEFQREIRKRGKVFALKEAEAVLLDLQVTPDL